ncbi:unnamed protein product [Dicrocoelium dendriticum]|nr:unnamed protein product [Dicrocoelium dendriticum]
MNSKFSKSEKTKLKFAQSNINHVYRGNAAETQHKPAVRQYGMQVVGKLQGTRRLPPPAWVPSLKAESGGVDGRVTLVPPGGSGWGATSTESMPTSSENVSTETVGPPITSTLPALNGSLSRDAIETIFEPAYARSKFESSTAELTTTGSGAIKSRDARDLSSDGRTAQVDGLSEHLATKVSLGIDSGSEIPMKSPAWPPKTSVTVASGGLAANKPFFQRPTTLTTSASVSVTQSDLPPPPVSKKVGACEVVGEPTGWVALSNQEINFDERILFSDEEDGQENIVEAGGTISSANSMVQSDYPAPTSQSPASLDKATVQSMAVSLPKADCVAPLDVPSTNHSTSDIWSAPGGPMEFGLSSHSSNQHLMAQMSEASLLPVGSTERTLLDNLYLPHTTLSHTFNPAFNEHYFLNNMSPKSIIPSASVGFTDSTLPSIDMDTEIQHAQRQARTQEFRSAVERAQQARIAQQKAISRSSGDSSHQRSVVDVIRETSGSPTSLQPHLAPPKFADSVLFPANRLSSHPFVGNAMQSQPFCPSSHIQATNQHRPDLAAAVAAATAVAVACNGNSGPSPVRSAGAMLPPSFVSASQPYQPFSAALHSATAGLCDDWSSPFPSAPASSIDLRGTHSSTIPQVLHNTLTTGCPRGVSPRANTVFLNPDYLVEKFLEILNRQQGVQHSSDVLTNSSITDTPANTTFPSTMHDRVSIQQPADRGASHVDARFACTPCNSDEFNSSGLNESVSKTDSLHSSTIISTAQPDIQCAPSVTHTSPDHVETKPEGKRVPGLMEVKVSTTSLDLAHLWEQNDGAASTIGRGPRGSSKLFSNKIKPHGRGRRSVVFSSGAAVSVNVNARTAHSHRASASPSTHVRQGTNVRDVETREEMSVPDQRRITSGRDDRRYSSTQKFRHAAGSGYTRQRDHFHENRFSDGEQTALTADGFRTHRRQSDVHSSRDNTSPRLVSKTHGRELNTDHAERKPDGHSLDDMGESTEPTSLRSATATKPVENASISYDDPDIPTVRVPASAAGFRFGREFTYTRGSRTTFSRGSSSWRTSGRSLIALSEDKYFSGSHGQFSKKYRGQRGQYRGDKSGVSAASFDAIDRPNTANSVSTAIDGYYNSGDDPKGRNDRKSVPCDSRLRNGYTTSRVTVQTAEDTVAASSSTAASSNRSGFHFPSDKRDARTAHSHRASASPSTHVRQGTNVRDVETREEMSVPDQRHITSGRDDRRYSSTQKFRHAAGSGYSRQRDYFHENRFSDGEQTALTADGFRTHRRQSDVHSSRDNTNLRLVSKTHGRELNTDHAERKPDGHSLDDMRESTEPTSLRGRGASGFHSQFSSRGVRVSFSRGGGSWKSGKSLSLQQESKRSSGSHAQISRRYRGQRDRYDDGKDDEGGAAAGGAGRSNTGGEGSSASGPGGACGVDGHNNLSGNQKSGGNRESGPTNNHRGVLTASVSTAALTEGAISLSSNVMTATDRRLHSDKSIYPRSCVRDRRHKEPSSLISGQGSNNGQRFFRMNSNREHKHDSDRHRLNFSHIPPLMSIKPRSLLTHAERNPESVTDNILDSVRTESGALESVEGGAFCDHDASDVDSVHSDGFTKVVSKASRKLARKRLQHESPLNKSFRLQSSLPTDPSSSRTFHFTSSCKSSAFSTSVTPNRFKTSYKPTFMGPPLSAVSSMPTVSFGTSWATSNDCGLSETTESWSSRMPLQSSVDRPPGVQTSGNRTWSKVVGSKSKPVDSENSPQDLPAHASESKWSEPTAKPTTNAVATAPQNVLPVSTCSSNASPAASVSLADASNSSAVEYSSVRRLWSTSCLGQNEFPFNTSAESISTSVPTSSSTIVRVTTSGVLADSNTTRTSSSTVANNICKVRPQQQQTSQPNVLQNKMPVAAPLAVSLTAEQAAVATTSVSERVICEGEAFDADYGAGILRGPQPHSALDVIPVQPVNFSPPSAHTSWVDSLTPQASSNFYATRIGTENPITAGVWPTSDPVLDTNAAGIIPLTCVGQTFISTTEAVPNVGHSSNTSTFVDPTCKPSHPAALFPRSQPYAVQHYPQTAVSDFRGSYDSTFTGAAKLISSDTAHSQPVFSNIARSIYVSPDQRSNNQSHFTSWGLQPSQHSQVPQHLAQQRYRPGISHQPDASFGSFAYQPDLQNELTYLPAVTGCVPPMPSGGLYSAIQDQSQSGYPHGSARHSVDSTGASSSWSIFGNPVGSSNLQTPSRDFSGSSTHATTGNGGGLLPHPSLLTGYGSIPCSVASGSSSSSNFLAHQNFVGVIGGGRINTDMPDTPLRPRGLSPNIYPTHNLSQSTQSQQQFQVHSAFYPSLSPSHQRIQLHHCRTNMHNLMNPQTGLYAAAFGAPTQPAQLTPPPLPTRVAYQNMASEPSVVPPMSFHSQLQSHSFQNVALQPRVHGPRAHQSSAPHLTRNLGSITNHATSPMLIAGAAGPTGLPGYAQPSPSLSGYPFKPVLPTL